MKLLVLACLPGLLHDIAAQMRLKRMLTFEIAAKNLMSFLVNVSLANVVSTSLLGNEISWSPTIAVVDS